MSKHMKMPFNLASGSNFTFVNYSPYVAFHLECATWVLLRRLCLTNMEKIMDTASLNE